jgi:hypothetical protein
MISSLSQDLNKTQISISRTKAVAKIAGSGKAQTVILLVLMARLVVWNNLFCQFHYFVTAAVTVMHVICKGKIPSL